MVEELLVTAQGIQDGSTQHGDNSQLQADEGEADAPVGQKRAGNEAGQMRPYLTAAQSHTVPEGPFESSAGCCEGPGHQPTARILTAGHRAGRGHLCPEGKPMSPHLLLLLLLVNTGQGCRSGPATQLGLVLLCSRSPTHLQCCREPCPQGDPIRWDGGVVGSARYRLGLHHAGQHSAMLLSCLQVCLVLLPAGSRAWLGGAGLHHHEDSPAVCAHPRAGTCGYCSEKE